MVALTCPSGIKNEPEKHYNRMQAHFKLEGRSHVLRRCRAMQELQDAQRHAGSMSGETEMSATGTKRTVKSKVHNSDSNE